MTTSPISFPHTSAVRRVHDLVTKICPFDDLEARHKADTLAWINSGAEIFRIAKPATPPQHLVSYFVILDPAARKVLLVDHKKALLWLPPGGHVDKDEDPTQTVRRECQEELNIPAKFWMEGPLFLTHAVTVNNMAGHTDVSLWYVLQGDSQDTYTYDPDEFSGIAWFDINDIPYDRADPHMERFIQKLKPFLSAKGAFS